MPAGGGFAPYDGQPVEQGPIPQWAFPGANPATLKIRAYRERVLALITSENAHMAAEIVAYCDQQIAAAESVPWVAPPWYRSDA